MDKAGLHGNDPRNGRRYGLQMSKAKEYKMNERIHPFRKLGVHLCIGLLFVLGMACEVDRYWSPDSVDNTCDPEARFRKDPRWANTLGDSQGGKACLQISWGKRLNEGVAIPVHLRGSGVLYGYSSANERFNVSPQFELPPSAKGKPLTFRVFVLLSRPDYQTHKTLCEEQIAPPDYNCLAPEQSKVCWFYLHFAPPEPPDKSLNIPRLPSGGICRLYSRCTKDRECMHNLVCRDGKCMDPKACKTDKDCPQGENCIEQKCKLPTPEDVFQGESTASEGISRSETDSQDASGTELANEQPSEPPENCKPGTLHCPCGVGCTPGLRCAVVLHRTQDVEICMQDCSSDKKLCASNNDGRTHCAKVVRDKNDKTFFTCIKQVPKDQSCDLRKGIFCQRDRFPPLYCSQTLKPGNCLEAQLQTKEGDACNEPTDKTEPLRVCNPAPIPGDTTKGLFCVNSFCKKDTVNGKYRACGQGIAGKCRPSEVCVTLATGNPYGYCMPGCTLGLECSPGIFCRELQEGENYCPIELGNPGDLCGLKDKRTYDPRRRCKGEDVCVTETGETEGICIQTVKDCKSCDEFAEQCTTLKSGKKGCFKKCQRLDDCGIGRRCLRGRCYALGQGGTQDFGKSCSSSSTKLEQRCCNGSSSHSQCNQGSRKDYAGYCFNSGSKGFCSADCSTKACPTITGFPVKCLTSQGRRSCFILCNSQKACPHNLKCDQGSNFCKP
mgnify:CR=1 FL=1